MEHRRNAFKAALARGERLLGLWSITCSTLITEHLAETGYDWIAIDMEHTPNETPDVLLQLQVLQRTAAEPVVRVAWNDPVRIKRVLDLGAQSLVVPYVQSAADARRAVAATRYPPDGVRGVVSAGRMNRFGGVTDYHRNAHREICLILQVETAEAADSVGEIVATEGVDAVFVGPSDLSASMGRIGEPGHPEVQERIRRIVEDTHRAGGRAGIMAGGDDDARRYLDWGYDFLALGSDMGLLARAAEEKLAPYRRAKR